MRINLCNNGVYHNVLVSGGAHSKKRYCANTKMD